MTEPGESYASALEAGRSVALHYQHILVDSGLQVGPGEIAFPCQYCKLRLIISRSGPSLESWSFYGGVTHRRCPRAVIGRLTDIGANQRARREFQAMERTFGPECPVPKPKLVYGASLEDPQADPPPALPVEMKGHSVTITTQRPGAIALGLIYGEPLPWWAR